MIHIYIYGTQVLLTYVLVHTCVCDIVGWEEEEWGWAAELFLLSVPSRWWIPLDVALRTTNPARHNRHIFFIIYLKHKGTYLVYIVRSGKRGPRPKRSPRKIKTWALDSTRPKEKYDRESFGGLGASLNISSPNFRTTWIQHFHVSSLNIMSI